MSLLDWGTYGRPDAEVLPLITPATARATDSVRAFRTGDARRAPPGGEAVDGAGGRGRAAGGGGGAAVPLRTRSPHPSRPPCKRPLPHSRSPASSLPHSSHRRCQPTYRPGRRPFTWPLLTAHRWRWCRRSSRRTRKPPRSRTRYALTAAYPPRRSPTPLIAATTPRTEREYAPSPSRLLQHIGGGGAGALRGVPGGRQGDEQGTPPPPPLAAPRASEATQRVLRGTRGHSELSPHSHSEAPQWPLRRHLSGHSEVLRGEIRGHSKAITRPQRQSEAIRGNQSHSAALRGHRDPRRPR